MQIVVEISLLWICSSVVLGPILAWAFFYPERQANAIQVAHDRWIATHPKVSLLLMPSWLRWENRSGDHRDDKAPVDLPQPAVRRH
jgi:hypothetical protein